MAVKAEKLGETFEALQLFLKKKSNEHQEFTKISQELEKLATHLTQKKLTVQIVSQNQQLAQAVFDLINTNQTLLEFYALKLDSLPPPPSPSQLQRFTSLKLQRRRENSTEVQSYYELRLGEKQGIGRSPECDISLDSSIYQGISWNHAVVEPVDSSSEWQICDLNSTNGTFVNGVRLQDCRVLKPGDKITLGSPQASDEIAQFIFDSQVSRVVTGADTAYWEIVDCDLLLLAIDSRQPLLPEEQQFIRDLDKTLIAKQFLIADIPDLKDEEAKSSQTNLAEIETWIKNQAPDSGFEVFPLFLKPYYDENQSRELESQLLKKQERFFKALENLVKRQPENILAQRLATKVIQALEPVEIVLARQEEALNEKISQEKQALDRIGQTNLKELTKKAIAKVNEDKDKFFKQIKLDLAQSKEALLDSFSKRSIIYKTQEFVDNLKPIVLEREGYKYVQLRDESSPKSKDINESLVDFCTSSLANWSQHEWEKICDFYGNGGLNGLFARSYTTIDIIPSLLSKNPFSSPQPIDIRRNLNSSFAGISCEMRYKQISIGVYIMNEIRSNMMQIMMMLTLGLSIVGITANRSKILGQIANTFKQAPWIFGLLVFGIAFFLINAYHQENNLKIEEIVQKLKKDLSSYYQAFTKNLLEKVIQDLNLTLESEDRKISNAIETVNQMYNTQIFDIENNLVQSKNNLEQYKTQQDILKKELSEFKKLKRL